MFGGNINYSNWLPIHHGTQFDYKTWCEEQKQIYDDSCDGYDAFVKYVGNYSKVNIQ